MQRFLFLFFLISVTIRLFALPQLSDTLVHQTKPEDQRSKKPRYGISFTGIVISDVFYDTRQTVMARDGHWNFYPEDIKTDAQGNDIHASGTFNMVSITTRLTGTISGPELLGAKSAGLIEGEFYGSNAGSVNTFRLRHAYVKLNWKTTELLIGQYWNPLFSPSAFPEVVSLNTGAPFNVFARNPQIRLTQMAGRFSFSLTALSQLDAVSNGPDGPSSKYLRNTMIPECNLQCRYTYANPEKKTEWIVGAGVDLLILTPRLFTEVTLREAFDTVINNKVVHYEAITAAYVSDVTTSALTLNALSKLTTRRITMKLGGIYGQNCFAFNLIGGYAVKNMTDPARGIVTYAPLNTGTVWIDVRTNGTRWQGGLFSGFAKNLGTGTTVSGPYYARGANIDYLYRVSPRVVFQANKLRVAGELEYTVAAYGITTGKGLVSNPHEVANLRVLVGVSYFF